MAAKKIRSGGDNAIALLATFVIHASIAAGIKWGGWLNVSTTFSPAEKKHRLVTVNLSTGKDVWSSKIENEFVPISPEIISPPEKKTKFYSNANSIAANPETQTTFKGTPRIKHGNSHALEAMQRPISLLEDTKPYVNLYAGHAAAKQSPKIYPDHKSPYATSVLSDTQGTLSTRHLTKMTAKPKANTNTKSAHLLPTLPDLPNAPTFSDARKGLGRRNLKEEGGVMRKGAPALDIRLTGFGDYDARFFAAISIAWRNQIRDRSWRPSLVIIDFNLYHDGKIDGLVIRETSALPILKYYCSEAIRRPAPFESWSKEMKEKLGKGPRHCRISFNYLVK